ncbi:hypothetical protein OROMI_012093 [Orobanche minor]
MEDQKKRTLEALERRFAQAKAEVHTQQHKGKKRPIADTERVASNIESPSVDSTLKRPSFDASSKKGNFSFRGHTHKQDVEVNEPAYLKLSHTVNENLLPDGVELQASDGKIIVNRVLHDILQRGDAAQKYNQGSRNLKIENNILLDNFVPKNGMPRARALHNESKRSKKHMSLKQHKKSGLFDLPKEFHKFEIFKPMHDKWKAYIQQLLKIVGKDELVQCFLNADLHGAIMLGRETTMEGQKKRTLEALERRFAQAKAEVHTQQHKGKKRPIADTKRVASNTESPSVDSTLKRPSFDASSKKGNFSFRGHTHKQDVEVNEPAYLKLSHTVNENLLPDGAELQASDGKIIVNRVLHDILQRGDAAQKYNQGSRNLKIENNILLDNFVPKNGMPRARALHNESKRSKKHMSLKQHKRSGLFDLPKEFHKFEIFKPMRDKWKAYIQQLLKIVGKDELAQCFLNADLHGAIMLGETTMEDQKKRTLEALERRFAHAKAEVHTQQHKGKKRPIADTKRVASNTESPSVDSTLKDPHLMHHQKKVTFLSGVILTTRYDVEVNEPAYLKLSHTVNENLLPDGAELQASNGKIIVNRVLHDILQHGDAAQKYNQGSRNLKIENNILLDNFVPKNGMPRARALHNESKRSKKHMSLKQHKRSDCLICLKSSISEFEIFKPMHDKWKAYIQQLLKIVGKDELAQCFLNADLHGAIMLGYLKLLQILNLHLLIQRLKDPHLMHHQKKVTFLSGVILTNKDVEVNEPAYLKLSHTVNENLLPDGAELQASNGKIIVNRVLHDILQRGYAAQKYNQGSRNLKIENNILLDNCVPKNGMPRARALHNESKRSKKHMSLKQHKRSGLFDLPKEFHKFEIFKPMHNKWKAYIQQLLKIVGKDGLAQCFVNADLHGAIMHRGRLGFVPETFLHRWVRSKYGGRL